MEDTIHFSTNDTAAQHQLPAGVVLKRQYQLQRVLGQGGFGITYLAWDHLSQKAVAVKEFYPESVVTRDCTRSHSIQCITHTMIPAFHSSRERFLREAAALERFRDVRAIVGIQDYFEENNTAYIVMEYIAGVSLKDYVAQRGGRLSVEETLRLLEPVFFALETVHREGVVHRDISPDNIMLDPREGARLLDFGAVRNVQNPSVEKGLTVSTVAVLKHGFAPIEQYNTRGSLGPWTDEYALCATIYYCLTGLVPEQVTMRISDNVSLAWERIPGLSPHQRSALERGMSINAKDRYPSVGQLYETLYHGENFAPSSVLIGDGKRKIKPLMLLAAAMVLGIGIIAGIGIFAGIGFGIKSLADRVEKSDSSVSAEGGSAKPSDQQDRPTPPIIEIPVSQPTTEPSEPETTMEHPGEDMEEPDRPDMGPSKDWIGNVMIETPLNEIFGTELEARAKILSVTFVDDLSGAPVDVYDLSADRSGSVVGWTRKNGDLYEVWIGAEGGMDASRSCRELFYECTNLVSVDFGGAFHTDSCVSMYRMFSGCHELRSIDVSSFNTSTVTTVQEMFRACYMLTELDVNCLDTSNVTNMHGMFSACTGLTWLDLTGLETSSLTNMGYMFSNNPVLRRVEFGNFDTSKVTNMAGVFRNCPSLEDMTLSWDISKVTDYSEFMVDGKTINGEPWQEYFR